MHNMLSADLLWKLVGIKLRPHVLRRSLFTYHVFLIGRCKVKVLPFSCSLSTETLPP